MDGRGGKRAHTRDKRTVAVWDDVVLYVKVEVMELTQNERVIDGLVSAARGKQERFLSS